MVLGAQLRQLLIAGAEDIGVVFANRLDDFYVCSIHGAQGQGTIHHELHIGRAGGFLASHRNLLGNISGRDDVLGGGDVVILYEDDANDVLGGRVVID